MTRMYRSGMMVRNDGRLWEIEAVEFWESDEKLHLRQFHGAGRVRTLEEWARNVRFEDGEVAPQEKAQAVPVEAIRKLRDFTNDALIYKRGAFTEVQPVIDAVDRWLAAMDAAKLGQKEG